METIHVRFTGYYTGCWIQGCSFVGFECLEFGRCGGCVVVVLWRTPKLFRCRVNSCSFVPTRKPTAAAVVHETRQGLTHTYTHTRARTHELFEKRQWCRRGDVCRKCSGESAKTTAFVEITLECTDGRHRRHQRHRRNVALGSGQGRHLMKTTMATTATI